MSRISPRVERAPEGARLKLLAALALVVGLIAVLQRSSLAPLPHGADDFLGGLAVGLALSALIARAAVRVR
jgi:hypothetical protein